MTFSVPYSSSPPSTPDKSRSLSSNPSTTPLGPPPSSVGSFTPAGPPPSTAYGSSRPRTRSKLNFSENAFGDSVNSQASEEDLLAFSTTSSNFPLPRIPTQLAPRNPTGSPRNSPFRQSDPRGFHHGNKSAFGRSSEYYPEGSDVEDDAMDGMEFEVSGVQEPQPTISQPKPPARKPLIYSNPNNAKRARLDERWVQQSPANKPKLAARKRPSALPSIARDLASRSDIAPVNEPSGLILESEDAVCRLYDQTREYEGDEGRVRSVISEISEDLSGIWQRYSAESTGSRVAKSDGEIGPVESSSGLAKASFLGSLLLLLHHPPLLGRKRDADKLSPMRRAASRDLILSSNLQTLTPIPKVLLDWINQNHPTASGDVDALRRTPQNLTMSPRFWNVVHTAVLRGNFALVIELLDAADFAYARTAMEDGHDRPGYRGTQLQNTQQSVNNVVKVLRSSPGIQYGDWDIKGIHWTMFRQEVINAISDLEDLANTEDADADDGDQFQAAHFGLSTQQKSFAFSQSTRMAESQIPWAIFENLKALYDIILGDVSAILSKSQDWLEATVGLTVWWDGDDDSEISTEFARSATKRPQSHTPRSVDANPEDAYLRRLDYAFASITETLGNDGFRINSTNALEVGLASVFEGNIQGVLEMLHTWSLAVTSSVADVASVGGWLDTSIGAMPMPGFSESDLMVLNYGQQEKPLQKDDILINYVTGLFERKTLEGPSGSRDGWELAFEVLSRLDDQETMKSKVSELLDRVSLDTSDEVDKVVLLCTELGFNEEGRKASERYGDRIAEESEDYGTALICYARAHCRQKIKNIVDLLTSFCLVRSMAYPAASELDDQLRSLLYDANPAFAAIAAVDAEGASMLHFHFCGYATVRRFYEIRDEEVHLHKGERPKLRPLASKKAAAEALVKLIGSAADSIYGGLYDPDRRSSIQVDGLLVLLGEALKFADEPSRFFTINEQLTLLAAIEDLQTVTPRVYDQCEECLKSTIFHYFHYDDLAETSAGGDTPSLSASFPSPPRNLLKKSVSSMTAFSGFSLIGSEMLESQNKLRESGIGSGMFAKPPSVGSSGVLVSKPDMEKSRSVKRGWDWRAGVHENIKGEDILRILRLQLAKGLSFGALGSQELQVV